MIVDCHTHINCPVSDVEAARHIEACEKVDACIVLAASCDDTAKCNKEISGYVAQHSKMTGFAVLNPVTDKISVRNIKAITKNLGLEGVVLYCCEDKFHPAHSRAMRFYEAAAELKLPVFFHNSAPFGPDAVLDFAQPWLLDEVARNFPSLKMIIGSMGVPFLSQTLCMIAKHENVYADLTILPSKTWEVYNIVLNSYEADVMDKLIFGSGFPSALGGNCIETLLGFNRILAEASLPNVPREKLRGIVERDTLALLGIGGLQ